MSITVAPKSNGPRSTIQFLWRNGAIAGGFRSGVSLHSHTMFSEESLGMVPQYTGNLPYVSGAIRRQTERYGRKAGVPFSFDDAFWTPPLAPRQAYRLEEKQIRRLLNLPALVSMTDHDDIRAGATLRVMDQFGNVPISTEWTIPFRGTFFHLGVHNLPGGSAHQIAADLADFTATPVEADLQPLLQMLNDQPDVLLVLNHPLWDEKGIGHDNHRDALQHLLTGYAQNFHALELNGLRHWQENRQVIQLAREAGLPVVSGGDRHGREPNSILNLSAATTFVDFVHEVRRDRLSHVMFMQQYREPLRLRILQAMVDVVREYPENAEGRKSWADRVFYRNPQTGQTVPVKHIWMDGGPLVVKQFVGAMRLLEWRGVRVALRTAFSERSAMSLTDSGAV